MYKTENETLNFRIADAAPSADYTSEWEKLTIKNRFIFAKVMQQKEFCLPLLQRLFPDLDITDIQYVEAEKTVEGSIGSKGVRFDVYVKDPGRYAFTLEMQVTDYDDLPRRSRYYSAMMCEDLLAAGRTYSALPPAYVVMLCPFDLFHRGLHRYTFTYTCAEDRSLALGDGSVIVFLNSRGTKEDVSPEILSFLKYMEGVVTKEDHYIVRLDEAVQKAKKNADWRREYMLYEMELAREKEIAREKGRLEGREEGREEGRQEGIEYGERLKLIRLIRAKMNKGMNLSTIAEHLEEEESEIRPLYELLRSMPEASPEEIWENLQSRPQDGQGRPTGD